MRKRVMFVDDEPREIQNLQRAVASMSAIWSMSYAGSGPAALELMTEEPFDAVVADMRMPGMDGLEFLNEVGKLYPKTLRFILSTFADRELIMTCVWGTHQFISKPCDPATLVSTVQHALALGVWLSNDSLKELVSKMGKFPSLPSTYLAVIKQLDSPATSVQSISDVIAKDLAVTAKLLQMVNSAFFGLPQKLTNPFEAVAILGMATVESLVLCIQVFTHFDKLKKSKFSMDALWGHSMRVATSAKRIALAETQDQKMGDEAFTAGLMHDIGKMVLAANLAEQYNAVLESARKNKLPLWQVEKDNFGASHAETGAYLLGLWGMPITLLEATALHHIPSQCFTKQFCSLTAVHVANAFAYERLNTEGLVPAEIDLTYLKEIGLEDRLDFWRLASASEANLPPAQAAPESESSERSSEPDSHEIPRLPSPNRSLRLVAPVAACFAFLLVIWVLWQSWKKDLAPMPPVSASNLAKAVTSIVPGELAAPDANNPNVPPSEGTTTSLGSSVANANSTTRNSGAALNQTAAPKANFPILKLQGIFYRAGSPSVMINGKILAQGGIIEAARVVAIDQQSVTLEYAGESRVLPIH